MLGHQRLLLAPAIICVIRIYETCPSLRLLHGIKALRETAASYTVNMDRTYTVQVQVSRVVDGATVGRRLESWLLVGVQDCVFHSAER